MSTADFHGISKISRGINHSYISWRCCETCFLLFCLTYMNVYFALSLLFSPCVPFRPLLLCLYFHLRLVLCLCLPSCYAREIREFRTRQKHVTSRSPLVRYLLRVVCVVAIQERLQLYTQRITSVINSSRSTRTFLCIHY